MAVHIAGNLKELIDDSAAGYINLNVDKFKSTTPGPVGPDGPVGPQGEGVHHMKGTSTTDPEGDFSTAGELDTYTFYADADELFPLAWFTVKNGEDPWRRAVDRGYSGTEDEFYTALTILDAFKAIEYNSIKEFPVIGEEGIIYVALDSHKTYRWSGSTYIEVTRGGVNSVNGRVGVVQIINSDITAAVGKDLTDAIKYSEADKTLTDVNKVNLSTDTSLVASAGQITWNPNERTADIGLDNNVVLQVGQETVVLVRNGTGVSIPDGTVVMLTGSIGNSGRLVVAPYDGVSDASLILGIATETITSNADGFVTSYGKIRGINTSMWSDGDVLYTNGSGLGLTPTSSLSMKIAVVVHSHTNGTLMVRVNGYSQVKEW